MLELGERRPTLALARRLDVLLKTGNALERLMPPADCTVPITSPATGDDGGRRPWLADDMSSLALSSTALIDSAQSLWQADLAATPPMRVDGEADLGAPLQQWLAGLTVPTAVHGGPRRVGHADVVALTAIGIAFTDVDHRLGGGYARTTLLTYLDTVLGPLLRGSYHDSLGTALFGAAARLLDLVAFMSFDAGYQALARAYFSRALSMVRTSGDHALAAHILADMAMQACHLVQPGAAVGLAEAATESARLSGARRASARSYAILARCRALAGDAAGADRAITSADRALARARADGPDYVQFFDDRQLTTEAMYAAGHLERWRTVRATADITTAGHEVMQRRHVLATATLADTYLLPGSATLDVPRACQLITKVIPLLPSLASARSLDTISQVRRSLAPYHDQPEVQAVEHDLIEAFAAA